MGLNEIFAAKLTEHLVLSSIRQDALAPLCRSDISFGVIHKLAERPFPGRHSSSSKLVNNSAAGHNVVGGRPALARSRSLPLNPKRVTERLPAEPAALAPTSNRKAPQEGHYIRAVDSRAKGRKSEKQQDKTMNNSEQWQTTPGIWRFGLGKRRTLRHRCRSSW